MKIIAHRGGMRRTLQNTPEGVRLAARHEVDFVELDVARGRDGSFRCVHAIGRGTALEDCLAAMGANMDLIAHLKGPYPEADLLRIVEVVTAHRPLARVIFASHRGSVLRRLDGLVPGAGLARFGLIPALASLWRRPPWHICLVNQLVLCRALVRALQGRGYLVYASCVWEWRSRSAVERLEVDGTFVNL